MYSEIHTKGKIAGNTTLLFHPFALNSINILGAELTVGMVVPF